MKNATHSSTFSYLLFISKQGTHFHCIRFATLSAPPPPTIATLYHNHEEVGVLLPPVVRYREFGSRTGKLDIFFRRFQS